MRRRTVVRVPSHRDRRRAQPAAAIGSATADSLESTASANRNAGSTRARSARMVHQIAASANVVASRSNRAEIHITASWFEACSANSSAAIGPASESGESRRPISRTRIVLIVWRSRFVRWNCRASAPATA